MGILVLVNVGILSTIIADIIQIATAIPVLAVPTIGGLERA